MKVVRISDVLESQDGLKIGDWVICTDPTVISNDEQDYLNFINNNIGQYFEHKGWKFDWPYKVRYFNIPDDIRNKYFRAGAIDYAVFTREDIKYWSEDKEKLELILVANKYNI